MDESVPLDGHAAGARRDTDTALRLALEPLHSALVVLDQRRKQLEAPLVVVLQPLLLLLGEHALLDHARLDRHAGKALEPEPDGPVKLAPSPHAAHSQRRLDAHPPSAIVIKARLVGDNVSGHQRHGAREPLRALMHSQERPKPVPGAVPVVQAIPPKRLARQNVKLMTRGAFWEDRTVDRDMALQDARKRVTLLW